MQQHAGLALVQVDHGCELVAVRAQEYLLLFAREVCGLVVPVVVALDGFAGEAAWQ